MNLYPDNNLGEINKVKLIIIVRLNFIILTFRAGVYPDEGRGTYKYIELPFLPIFRTSGTFFSLVRGDILVEETQNLIQSPVGGDICIRTENSAIKNIGNVLTGQQ